MNRVSLIWLLIPLVLVGCDLFESSDDPVSGPKCIAATPSTPAVTPTVLGCDSTDCRAAFSVISGGAARFEWSFPGASPSASDSRSPEVRWSLPSTFPKTFSYTVTAFACSRVDDPAGTFSSSNSGSVTFTAGQALSAAAITNLQIDSGIAAELLFVGSDLEAAEHVTKALEETPVALWPTYVGLVREARQDRSIDHRLIRFDLGESVEDLIDRDLISTGVSMRLSSFLPLESAAVVGEFDVGESSKATRSSPVRAPKSGRSCAGSIDVWALSSAA